MNFPKGEFETRFARLREALEQVGLDALLVSQRENFNYFTGFICHQPWTTLSRSLVALLPRQGEPALIVPGFLDRSAREESWIERVYTHATTGVIPLDAIAQALSDLGLRRGGARVGAEIGREQRLNFGHRDFLGLVQALPDVQFEDAYDAIWPVRMIKSAAEIDCLRQACRVLDTVFAHIFTEFRPGMTERQVASRMAELMLREGADQPGWNLMTSGRGEYHRFFGTPRDRAIQRGEMLWMDVSLLVNGYWADYARSGVPGGPSQTQRELQQIVQRATQAGIQQIGPGVPASRVAQATNAELERLGIDSLNFGRLGHGIGLTVTEPPDIAVDNPLPLHAGMVVTVEPAIIREDGLYQAEQNVLVTEQGYEVLSQAPWEIQTLPC